MESTKTTREVADDLAVNMKTLQLWVREETVRPIVHGEGKRRRIEWTQEAIEQARRCRDREAKESPLLAALGPDLISAMLEAKRMRDYQGDGDVIVAGSAKGRIFRSDAQLGDVLKKMRGSFFVLMR